MNAEEQQKDSFAKLVKDLVVGKVSMMVKAAAPIIGLVLLLLVLLVAVVAIPVIAVIAVLYNSPFAIFLPSISTGDTTQNVLSAYVSEFNGDITTELNNLEGCDRSEKVYVNFGGEGIPDNYCDILVVYMVKYGDGDTATDMTDKAKENLKKVFDDMCSYTTSTGTETETDAEGNETEVSVKYVNVTLKTYQDMISEYGFNTEEQEMLAELMKPENLMMLGYSGNNGGQNLSPEQYQAIVDAIGSLSYTRMDTVFEQGQTLHNLNGSDYRVMEKLSDRNLLLMDIKTGKLHESISDLVWYIRQQSIPNDKNRTKKKQKKKK